MRKSTTGEHHARRTATRQLTRAPSRLNRVRHIINKKNTQFILDHQHDSLRRCRCTWWTAWRTSAIRPRGWEVIGGDFWNTALARGKRRLRSVYDGKAAEFLKTPGVREPVRSRDPRAAAGVQL